MLLPREVSHVVTLMATGSCLECREVLWGESWDGATQGDPESGPYFAAAIHKFVSMEKTC